MQPNFRLHRALLAIALTLPGYVLAAEWKTDTSEIARYFDNNDARPQHYFESSTSAANLTVFRSEPTDAIRSQGLDKVCVMVHALKGSSGLFNKTVHTSFHLINLAKIKSAVWAARPANPGRDHFDKYTITLTDGTTMEAVEWSGDEIVACGNNVEGKLVYAPLKWTSIKLQKGNACVYTEPATPPVDQTSDDIYNALPVNAYAGLKFQEELKAGFGSFDPYSALQVRFGHDSAAQQNFAACYAALDMKKDLERRVHAAKAARREAANAAQAAAQEDAKRKREEFNRQLVKEAQAMRASLKVGGRTNCGQVFDIKFPMVGVQTMYGMQFIDINRLWGPSAGCHFRNGVYIGIDP